MHEILKLRAKTVRDSIFTAARDESKDM